MKNRSLFLLGNFQDKNIFYDKQTGKLYSITKKEEKSFSLAWAVLPASLLLRNIYSEATASQVVSLSVRILILLSTFISILVLLIIILRRNRQGNMEIFDQNRYFEWPNFLHEQKKHRA
ncbi:hypothetical protein ACVRXQ_13070 [Streptococcus panodentis]|uniref:hypothetical protein n=1 Tax=Streptococcus panodentis TaxID=1581472 RepID=UPI001FD8DEE6|nr:hypothetical protein [Streptococcus panodentis]